MGWASMVLAGVALLIFAGLSVWVEAMNQAPAGSSTEVNVPATAINIGVLPYIFGGLSIVLGWLAIILRKDRSAVLFALMIAMTAQALFVIVFEVLEVVL
jgi:hypothetical protein